jgi:hypothetical protein
MPVYSAESVEVVTFTLHVCGGPCGGGCRALDSLRLLGGHSMWMECR